MAKIILTSRYIKNPAKAKAGKLIQYMGTREGAEKLSNGIDNSPATKKQKNLICDAITAVPESMEYLEFKHYSKVSTKSSATEYLDAVLERNFDKIEGVKNLVKYYGERPGVERLGKHGLFSFTDDKIDIDKVADEVANHKGILWTHVVSLTREDAERLRYNNANKWKELLCRNTMKIAEAHKIDPSNLQWYAAFHNTTHHPHIHIMVYAKNAKQGYLTNKGIENLRSTFGNDIFRNEQYKLFELETRLRDELKDEVKHKIIEYPYHYETPEIHNLFEKLITQFDSYKGKMKYGYFPKAMKNTVNAIVRELAKNEEIADLYSEWNDVNREKLSLYYEKKDPDIPLEENKEFRSIKNMIIQHAVKIKNSNEYTVSHNSSFPINSLIKSIASLITNSSQKKKQKLHSQMSKKEMQKFIDKKEAQGLKVDISPISNDGYDEPEKQELGLFM